MRACGIGALLLRGLHGAAIRLLLLEVCGAAHAAGGCGRGRGLRVVGLRLLRRLLLRLLRLVRDRASLRLALIREHVPEQLLQRRFLPVEAAGRAAAHERVGLEGGVRPQELEHLAQLRRLEVAQTDLHQAPRQDLGVHTRRTAQCCVVRGRQAQRHPAVGARAGIGKGRPRRGDADDGDGGGGEGGRREGCDARLARRGARTGSDANVAAGAESSGVGWRLQTDRQRKRRAGQADRASASGACDPLAMATHTLQ